MIGKMKQYAISEQKVRSIINRFDRKEEGIAKNTIAVMKRHGSAKRPYEIWVMYQKKIQKLTPRYRDETQSSNKITIISTWKYPGISPIGKEIPIPDDVLEELSKL